MSNTKDKNQQSADNSKRKIPITRRGIIGVGVVGIAAVTAKSAIAQTQKPIAPETGKADSKGKFTNKVVLITGATSGIGEGTAYAFAKEGAKVFFCGRRENLGRQVEARIKGFGGEATYMRADVRREEDVKAFVDACVKKYGRVDIAFNNAGIVNPKMVKLHEQPTTDFLDVLHTNALGEFL